MKIKVELPDDVLRDAVASAARTAFDKGFRYEDASGYGYKAVMEQTKAHILAIDFSEIIAIEAKRQLANVVSEVVQAQLREAVKAQARRMRVNGELLEEKP